MSGRITGRWYWIALVAVTVLATCAVGGILLILSGGSLVPVYLMGLGFSLLACVFEFRRGDPVQMAGSVVFAVLMGLLTATAFMG